MQGRGIMQAQMSKREFEALRALVHDWAGIWLNDAKRSLMEGRLAKRLRQLELDSYGAYLARITAKGPAADEERTRFLDAIATNETHFFREPGHWELLERDILPHLKAEAAAGRRPRRVRAWSAACSTGDEPYSLAMSLLSLLPREEGWTHEIRATDISTRVLGLAQAGLWSVNKAHEIPTPYLKRFMLKGTGEFEGKMKASRELRDLIHFARFNMKEMPYAPGEPFDIVFCRNVLIYFDADMKRRVVSELVRHVKPGGYFFVGHAESLHGFDARLKTVVPTVYRVLP
jgi:chemotaxis protein methyltransferase CheR